MPVDVQAGAPQGGHAGVEAVFAHHLAQIVDELLIEGGGLYRFGRIHARFDGAVLCFPFDDGAARIQRRGIADAGAGADAVVVVGAGEVEAEHGVDGAEVLADHGDHLFHHQLVQDIFPHLVVIRFALCHEDVEGGVRAVGVGIAHRLALLIVGKEGDPVDHLFGGGDRLQPLRPGAAPVGTGQIGGGAFAHEVVQIRLVQTVGIGGFGFVVEEAVFGGEARVGKFIFAESAEGVVFPDARQVFIPCDVCALGGQHVVEGVVRALAYGEIVAALVQDPGLGVLIVPAGDVVQVHLQRHFRRCARLQDARLAEVDQLDGRFFHAVLFVVLRVRRLHVQLHHFFARHVAFVGDAHGGGDHVVFHRQACKLLREIGVREAVAEGIVYLFVVIPVAAACEHARGRGGVALPEHAVFIARFIILIADVDALAEHRVLGAARADADGGSGSGDGVRIGIGDRARRLVRRRRAGARRVGIDELARRADLARQDLAHRFCAEGAQAPDLQDGAHARVLFEGVDGDGRGRIDDDHDLAARLFGGVHQVKLGLRQFIIAVGRVAAFARHAGKDDDTRIRIAGYAAHRQLCGRNFGGRICVIGDVALGVEVPHLVVDSKSRLFQPTAESPVDVLVAEVADLRVAGIAAIDRVIARPAEQRHPCARRQRQRAVFVFEKDGAFIRHLFDDIQLLLHKFVDRSRLLFEVLGIRLFRPFILDDLVRRRAQDLVDVRFRLVRQRRQPEHHGEDHREYRRESTTQPFKDHKNLRFVFCGSPPDGMLPLREDAPARRGRRPRRNCPPPRRILPRQAAAPKEETSPKDRPIF